MQSVESTVPSSASATSPKAPVGFSDYQKKIVAIVTFLQFTIILDFMILSPMGAILMPAFKITTVQFGMVVSVYAFAAGIAGFLAAGFADRFDRKKLLLFFYGGFLIGTLGCALAPTYEFLLIARMFTGVFGGVIGSVIFAIATDLFPYEMRGRVMGFVQSSFAASQVLGIPFALFLSNHWGWHSPFMLIVGLGLLVGGVMLRVMKPIDGHLAMNAHRRPLHHLVSTVTTPRYVQAFATGALLSTGGFMLMPFASAFSVNNLRISLAQLPIVYLVTGIGSMIAGPLIGRISDRVGKFRMFCFGSLLSIAMILIYTRLGVTPLWAVILVNVILFIGISSRMISSAALMSAIPNPESRGAFMSVSASVQQVSGGIASVLAGLLVVQASENAPLEHFDRLGNVVVVAILITVVMMYFIHTYVREKTA